MKAILVGLGSAGDVHPMAGLALALRRRGHGVLLAAPSVFEPLAVEFGLDFAGLGTEGELREALEDPDLWHPYRGFYAIARRLIVPWMRPVFELIAEHREGGETVVAAPATALGARIAQERLGVPLATVLLQPAMIRSLRAPPCYGFPDIIGRLPRILRGWFLRLVDRWVVDPPLAAPVDAFRAELGLAPVRRIFHRWAFSPRLVVGFFPEWFAPPQPDWIEGVRLAGFPLFDGPGIDGEEPGLEEFLGSGAPPVVFTAGTAMTQASRFFRAAAEACSRGGLRGLFLTGHREQLPPELPPGCRWFRYAPFGRILPRCGGIVHHGGIGTVARSLAAGIPQLVVPFAHDQPDNAVRLRRLGVGDFMTPGAFGPAAAHGRLSRLMGSATVRKACRKWSAAVGDGEEALARACDLLEGIR